MKRWAAAKRTSGFVRKDLAELGIGFSPYFRELVLFHTLMFGTHMCMFVDQQSKHIVER